MTTSQTGVVLLINSNRTVRLVRRKIEGTGTIRRCKIDGKRVKVVPYRQGARQTWRLA